MHIETKYLRAVSRAMAKKDVRYYLNGMKIESTSESVVLIATDGHRMHVCRFPNASGEVYDAIVPASLILSALKSAGRKIPAMDFSIADGKVTITVAGSIVSESVIDGVFPDWRRVLPDISANTLENPFYRPEYLQDANDAILDISGENKLKTYPVLPVAGGMGYMRYDNFLAIIMPIRFSADDFDGQFIAWFRGEV